MTTKATALLGLGLLLMGAQACTTDPIERRTYEGPPVGSRPAALVLAEPTWDDAMTGYFCATGNCAARFGVTLTTDRGYEPTVKITVVNMATGVEDSLNLPLSVLGSREVRFTGLPAGSYESYVTVTEQDMVELAAREVAEVHAYVDYEWTADVE